MVRALLPRWLKLSEACWRLFISLKLTFVLLAFLGLGAFLGMTYDQNLSFEEFFAKAPSVGVAAFFLNFFELNDAFHSWWYSLVILLLSANLIACSIERLPRIYFEAIRPRPYLTDRRLLGLTLKQEIYVKDEDAGLLLINKFIPGLPSLDQKIHNSRYFYKERQMMGRFGVYVVHIALLIVMYSSIYTTQNGISAHVLVEEGTKTRFVNARGVGGITYIYDLGFYVGCDDFRLRTFVDNSPMEFESDLFVSTQEKDRVLSKTVRVNEPLNFANFTFYQSSFKPVISEKVVELIIHDKDKKERHRTRLNSEIMLANKEILVPEKLYDDFAGLGQALRIAKKSPDGSHTFFHIFRQYPNYDREVRQDSFDVTLLESDQRYATGLSIGFVPGISVIFSGFLLFLFGVFMCFFMTPTRFFARLDYRSDGIWVIIAAQGFRHLEQVRMEFNLKAHALNNERLS